MDERPADKKMHYALHYHLSRFDEVSEGSCRPTLFVSWVQAKCGNEGGVRAQGKKSRGMLLAGRFFRSVWIRKTVRMGLGGAQMS